MSKISNSVALSLVIAMDFYLLPLLPAPHLQVFSSFWHHWNFQSPDQFKLCSATDCVLSLHPLAIFHPLISSCAFLQSCQRTPHSFLCSVIVFLPRFSLRVPSSDGRYWHTVQQHRVLFFWTVLYANFPGTYYLKCVFSCCTSKVLIT